MYARKVDDSLASEQGYLPPRTPAVALALIRLLRTRTTLRAAHRCLQLGPRAEVALILASYVPMCRQLPPDGCALHGGAMAVSSAVDVSAPAHLPRRALSPICNTPSDWDSDYAE